ncbi:hypothetical protein CIG19_10515 [Enterobacterales bacterium CwR94]|nr:hypothetical protein CIG19_10515 [Enterobacterales bacterium CwR94]
MKKIIMTSALIALFISSASMAATPTTGEAAGAQAFSSAKGQSDAEGVTAVAALLGVALATMGGHDGGGTSTTTSTTPNR